ncbi:MAG: ferredoxin [Flavobacteriia bacterium]|nr:ferredoxin [Flavobacteriia bacterium]
MSTDILVLLTDREGNQHKITAPTDMQMNLMEVFKAHELPVEGTCGGMALCASCQCYIESDHPLSIPSDEEEAMLSEAFYVKQNSRLSCQILITPELEGLQVSLAPEA